MLGAQQKAPEGTGAGFERRVTPAHIRSVAD